MTVLWYFMVKVHLSFIKQWMHSATEILIEGILAMALSPFFFFK